MPRACAYSYCSLTVGAVRGTISARMPVAQSCDTSCAACRGRVGVTAPCDGHSPPTALQSVRLTYRSQTTCNRTACKLQRLQQIPVIVKEGTHTLPSCTNVHVTNTRATLAPGHASITHSSVAEEQLACIRTSRSPLPPFEATNTSACSMQLCINNVCVMIHTCWMFGPVSVCRWVSHLVCLERG